MPPWDRWIPGVLSRGQVSQLIRGNYLENFDSKACDHSSIDLHVTGEAYQLTKGSVKPSGSNYLRSLEDQGLATKLESNSKSGEHVLEKMAKLTFYRMSEDASDPGENVAVADESTTPKSPYMDQTLQLSKHFGPWT